MKPSNLKPRWVLAEMDRPGVNLLAEKLDLSRPVAHLLCLRGLTDPEAAAQFLQPDLARLSDPFSLTDMDRAVERISRARQKGEHVLVFGDYDVDGITASVILLNALRRFGIPRVSHGMPSRLTEGYGLSVDRVDWAHDNGVNLVITVDNGINARGPALRAQELGLDLIITDHHQIEGDLPVAHAIVNPKREAPEHPAYMLCGAGVAYRLACALNGDCEDLDLASLGTIADIVPLVGENRAIAAMGLAQMRHAPKVGLTHLARQSKADISRITSERVAFALAPRLNAAGRLGDGSVPLSLLLTQSDQDASRLAAELDEANAERREIEEEIFQSAVATMESDLPEKLPAIVLASREWHSGVVGIVAARIASRYNRPTLLVAYDEDGLGRGSARGGPGFNLADAIGVCQEFLVKFGGHKNAAGFTIHEDKFEAFREMFLAEAAERLPGKVLQPELNIDILIGLSQIDGQLISALERLEPCGQQNPSPLFCTCGVEIVPGSAQPIANKHLRMVLAQEGVRFPAIAYRVLERMDPSELPKLVDIVYTPKFDTYRGGGAIQLELRDIATSPRL